ncbi:GntR family transcriptional regulator [Aciditerrimonas ferrireducens]|uniref:GntR family transcriptional regulator n=1 Tax=Aciditerrimonas ferrireducens TaxID=667306 RepID=A0ABV6C4I7_9ACTN
MPANQPTTGRGVEKGPGRFGPSGPSAVARAYEHAKARLLDGSLGPGDWLTEGEVADALGISRTPVREAFLHLQAEGLLTLHPRRGAQVVGVDPATAAELLEVRHLLEHHAATCVARAGEAVRRAVVVALEEVLASQVEARRTGDRGRFVALDRELHRRVVAASGNRVLEGLYGTLRDRQQRLVLDGLRADPSRAERILEEHRALLEALAEGDPAAYDRALRRHLAGSLRALRGAALDPDLAASDR